MFVRILKTLESKAQDYTGIRQISSGVHQKSTSTGDGATFGVDKDNKDEADTGRKEGEEWALTQHSKGDSECSKC